jgi:hypothetical protein
MNLKRRDWVILFLIFILLFAGESFIAYRYLIEPTSLGLNDFYSRWAGARAWLIEGRDPYGLDVTAEIQQFLGATHQAEGRSGFHYPMHVTFLFLPLINVPYPITEAIWLVTLQWVAIGIVVASLARLEWWPSPLGMIGLLLVGILIYPAARTMLLGQFTLHVTLFLALALLMLHKGHDGWAGIFLAATSIKPQMVVIVGIWLVLWAVGQRRWRFIWGVLGGGLLYLLGGMLLYPRWLLSFWEDVQRYADVAGGRSPLLVLLEEVGLPGWLHFVLGGLLVVAMLFSWWRARQAEGTLFDTAVYWSLVVTVIVPFQTGSTNKVLLLIPIFAWLYAGVKRWGGWPIAGITAVIIIGLWLLFLNTLSGDYENQIMFLPLPFLSLLILIVSEFNPQKQGGMRLETGD